MQQNSAHTRIKDILDMILLKHGLTVNHNVVTLNRHNLAGILIHEILNPCAQHPGSQLAANGLFQIGFVDPHLFGKVENLDDVLIALKPDGTQQRCHRQLLLTVDIGIHHIVDVCGKLNPRPAERDDTRRIKLRAVGMGALSEEHTRRAVKLRHNDTLSAIDHKRTLIRHIRNRAQINILHNRCEILMIRISAIKFQLSLQRHTVSLATLQTLLYRVTGRVDVIIQEFKNEIVPGVRNREILCKNLVETLVISFFRRSVKLKEIFKRLQLHLEKIGVRKRVLYRRKVYAGFICC